MRPRVLPRLVPGVLPRLLPVLPPRLVPVVRLLVILLRGLLPRERTLQPTLVEERRVQPTLVEERRLQVVPQTELVRPLPQLVVAVRKITGLAVAAESARQDQLLPTPGTRWTPVFVNSLMAPMLQLNELNVCVPLVVLWMLMSLPKVNPKQRVWLARAVGQGLLLANSFTRSSSLIPTVGVKQKYTRSLGFTSILAAEQTVPTSSKRSRTSLMAQGLSCIFLQIPARFRARIFVPAKEFRGIPEIPGDSGYVRGTETYER